MSTESTPTPPPAIKDERSHFLAHMGHDLRAPMTNILALTEALVDGVYGPMPPAQSETLKHIRENGHRMINMVTDLVDLARIETGQIKLELASAEIMEPCRSGIEMARGQAKAKNVTVESEQVPPSVTAVADARRLRQLSASLANAAVVSAPAGGRVKFRVEAQQAEGRIRMEILTSKRPDQNSPVDNSISQPSVEALQRLRKMSSVAVTMVEKIIQLHDGTLTVTDGGSHGFSLVAEVPAEFPEYAVKKDRSTAGGPAVSENATSGGPFILLADDEEIIRTITKDYLESIGYRVACVTNGKEALDFLQEEAPDLLILDMQMPVLDGMDALGEIRRSPDPRIAKTRVISLSGLVTPGHRERCLAAGANGCLAKPFGIKDLERVIKEMLVDRE